MDMLCSSRAAYRRSGGLSSGFSPVSSRATTAPFAASGPMPYRLAMIPRRPSRLRPRIILRVVGVLLLLVAAAAEIALLARPAAPTAALEPAIPNEQALIDAGLSGTPAPGQPTSPFVVDRVLVDHAATYVQYHLARPLPLPPPPPPPGSRAALVVLPIMAFLGPVDVSSDQGGAANTGGGGGLHPSDDWPFPVALPAWSPWHPPVTWRGYSIGGALPPTARVAIVRFLGRPGKPGAGETVRVPLDLRALVRRAVAFPLTTARTRGLTLTLQEVDFTHITYTYDLPPNGTAYAPRLQFVGRGGHSVPAREIGDDCSGDSSSMSCTSRVVFPPQHAGTHLTLTIPILQINGRPLHGPWQLSFIVP